VEESLRDVVSGFLVMDYWAALCKKGKAMKLSKLPKLFPKSTDVGTAESEAARFSSQATFCSPDLGDWYHPVLLGPSTLGNLAAKPATLRQAIRILEHLESDEYVRYLFAYYQVGLERFGDAWYYADIVTTLLAAAQVLRPQSYLEIGVRRGRSMAMVAATCPECDIVGFDQWIADYAGMPNPGSDFVRAEMAKLGFAGRLQLIDGNSHETLPRFFAEHPDTFFDLITVDGDHSKQGAAQDLRDVLARIKLGGVLVFDDICHPSLPHLRDVWQRIVVADGRFATWEFTELGYGIALAVRRES
jgi:predicted O-methyltransferase YrrM